MKQVPNMMTKILPVILVMLISAGCSKNYMAEREFYQAKRNLSSLNPDDPAAVNAAISSFQQIANKYPTTPKAQESLQIISKMHLKQKNFAEARAAMSKLIESSSNSKEAVADARYTVGQIYEVEGNWRAAEQTYWDLAEYSPMSMKGLYSPVRILTHYKQSKESRELKETFVKALDHYEGLIKQMGAIEATASVKNYLALAYLVNEDLEKAISLWLNIADSFPKSPFAPMGLLAAAEQEWNRGNIDKATPLYARYFDNYPSHFLSGQTSIGLGMRYHQKKEFSKAREWYQKALDLYFSKDPAKQADLKLLMAKTYQDEVLWSEADSIYTEIETQFPNTTAALQVPLIRANYFQELGERKKADSILDEALEKYSQIDGSNDEKLLQFTERMRANALAQKGDWDKVVEEVDKHMNEETSEDKRGRWLFLKALLTKNRLNKPDEAALLFQEFLQKYPKDPLAPKATVILESLPEVSGNS